MREFHLRRSGAACSLAQLLAKRKAFRDWHMSANLPEAVELVQIFAYNLQKKNANVNLGYFIARRLVFNHLCALLRKHTMDFAENARAAAYFAFVGRRYEAQRMLFYGGTKQLFSRRDELALKAGLL